MSDKLIISDDEFLEWYAEICDVCKKHGIYFGGCGCCDSPFIIAKLGDREFCDIRVDFDGVLEEVGHLQPLERGYELIRRFKGNERRSI